MVIAALGLEEDALAQELEWARGRADQLLAVLDDAELRALLEPAGRPRHRAEALDDGVGEALAHSEALVPDAEAERAPERAAAPVGAERRVNRRYSLVEPAVVEVASWSELVSLYTKDIGCGGMFVLTDTPPPRDTSVGLQLLLPDEAGTLDFVGVVVHVVTAAQAKATGGAAGFGLQFSGLTAERRRALQRLIEQAEVAAAHPEEEDGPRLRELGFACAPSDGGGLRLTLSEAEHQQMQQLRAELAAMTARGDLEMLGLPSEAGLELLRDAFERLARRWHPSVAHRDAPPEIRQLATEIFLRIEQAYHRLRDAPRPAGVLPPPPPFASSPIASAPRVGPPHANDSSIETIPSEPAPAPVVAAEPVAARRAAPTTPAPEHPRLSAVEADEVRAQQRARLARRMVGSLVERSEQLATQLRRRDRSSSPPPRDEHRTLVDEALRLVADKRYAEAAEQLEQALRQRAEPRVRVLLNVVKARQALTERDFPRARASYEAVLQLDPSNALAQRELLMLAAMQR